MTKTAIIITAACLSLGLAFAGCSQGGTSRDSSPVLAEVNGERITVDEFKAETETLPPFVRQMLVDDETKNRFLDELINKKLLVQQAKKAGLDKDPEYVERINQTSFNMLLQMYVTKEVFDKAEISDQDVRDYFDKNRDSLGSARISHIQVGTSDEAEEVLVKYKAGASFLSLAKQYSQDKSTRDKGGDLGFLDWSQFGSPILREAAFNTPLGEVSNVIRSSFAYHVIKVTDRRPAKDTEFDRLKDILKEDLREKKREELFNAKITELKDAAKIDRKPEALTAMVIVEQDAEPPAEPDGM